MMITAHFNSFIRAISKEKLIKRIIAYQSGILSILLIVFIAVLISMNGTKNRALFPDRSEQMSIPADLLISKNLQEFKMIFFGGAYISNRPTFSEVTNQLDHNKGRLVDPVKKVIH
jgi:hypothetical protein